jgi:hypothetical protein
MIVPSMLNMADVMAENCETEEYVFDLGITGAIVFLVVVPLIGACRVPVEALSHFMAGADDYTAEGMPEHWSGALSGTWAIKRDRLRILESSWNDYSYKFDKLVEELEAASQPQATTPSPAPEVQESAPGGETLGAGAGGALLIQEKWTLREPKRYQGYARPLYLVLKAAHGAGTSCPRPRDVLDSFSEKMPSEVIGVQHDGLTFYDARGNSKVVGLEAIAEAIRRMTS